VTGCSTPILGRLEPLGPQVVADGQPMLSHFGQHGSDEMTKTCAKPTPLMPTDLNPGWIFLFNTEAKSSGLAIASFRLKYKVLRRL